jgi:nitroimidazol reductase NimA-like FMN-containing flavoprotein (pyridoxamine 5'-phosphate oxidase superfamily)
MAKDRFSFDSVEKAVRTKTFGVLTTIDAKGRPHSTGIIYGVSPPTSPFALYILVGENYAKVRNIKRNPSVSLVVTFPHYYVRFAPASYAMFRGTAEIVPFSDPDARWAMSQK